MPRRREKYEDQGDIWEDDEQPTRRARHSQDDEDEPPRAPLMLRVLAWVGVILLCFVGGYLGTSWAIRALNQQDMLVQKDVVKTADDLNKLIQSDAQNAKTPDRVGAKKISLKLHYPKGNSLSSEPFEIITGLKEEDIQAALTRLFAISEMFTNNVVITHIFRNAGTLYLDMSGSFIPKLSEAGKEKSALFINGLVRTMSENFSPITEVRFLVNGAITTTGSPVDLTVAWK